MFRLLLFLLVFFTSVFGLSIKDNSVVLQPCEDKNSVVLTHGETFHDDPIVFDGVTFPPEQVYRKNVSGEFRTFGCLCNLKNCVRKCCPVGSIWIVGERCVERPREDVILNYGLNLSYMNSFKRNVAVSASLFGLVFGKPCTSVYLEDDGTVFLQQNGHLYIELPQSIPPWTVVGPDKYCIDTFIYEDQNGETKTHVDALVCFLDNQDEHSTYPVSSSCMLISCVFILATVAVYAWLPELRNLHGRVLVAYLMCLFVGFLFMSTMQILLLVNNISLNSCVWMTFVIYFFLLSAFFWLNVMCFDIWWTFSGKRGLSEKLSTRARFCAYAMYAFGVPSALTILLAALEFSSLPAHPLMPNIKHQGCFLFGTSKLLYLYGPIVILCVANMMFFVLTAVKITQIKRQTSVLKSRESAMHDQHRNDKQRLLLYVKLFVVMGVNWLLEVISAIYPDAESFWRYTDAYNVLIGLIIFIIFVCKRKILRLMKKRYRQLRGDPMSRTQTVSSRTASSRDDIRMNSTKIAT